jgi:hypothetical protein
VPVDHIQNFETFTIEINDINSKGEGFLKIWENTMVKISLKSKADADTMALIDTYLIQKKVRIINYYFRQQTIIR